MEEKGDDNDVRDEAMGEEEDHEYNNSPTFYKTSGFPTLPWAQAHVISSVRKRGKV